MRTNSATGRLFVQLMALGLGLGVAGTAADDHLAGPAATWLPMTFPAAREPGVPDGWRSLCGSSNPQSWYFEGEHRKRIVFAYMDVGRGAAHGQANTYYQSGRDIYIAYYDLEDEQFRGPWKAIASQVPGDRHNGPAIFVDSKNKLHVMNSRGQIRWTRSKRSLDEDLPFRGGQESFDDFEDRKEIGSGNSYAHPVIDGNGQLWVFTRTGSEEHWRTSTDYAGDWASASLSTVIPLTGFGRIVYMRNKPHVDLAGNIHLMWMELLPGTVYTMQYLYYAKWCIERARWEKSDGTAYALPITRETGERIYDGPLWEPPPNVPMPHDHWPMWHCWGERSDGTIYFATPRKASGKEFRPIMFFTLSGGRWSGPEENKIPDALFPIMALTYQNDSFFCYGAKDQGSPGSISGKTLVRYHSDGGIDDFAPDLEIGIPFDNVISPLTSVPINWHPRYPILIGYVAGRDGDGEPYGNISLLKTD